MGPSKTDSSCGDILLVAHGHILRAFAMRWVGKELTEGVSLLLEGKPPTSQPAHCRPLKPVQLAE